jgi:hypothetical protein
MAANPRTPARKTAARIQSRRTAEEPDVDVTPAEAQEVEAEGHYVTAELCGEEIQIVPPAAWRTSWQRMLNEGNLDGFAERVFHPDDYDLYLELDPTIIEFMTLVEDAASRSGESMGKSGGPAPSSRRTRRR